MAHLKLSMLRELKELNHKNIDRSQITEIGSTPQTLEKHKLIKPTPTKGLWEVDLPEGFSPEAFFKSHQNYLDRARGKTKKPLRPEVRRYINPYLPKQEKEIDRRPWKKMYRQLKSS